MRRNSELELLLALLLARLARLVKETFRQLLKHLLEGGEARNHLLIFPWRAMPARHSW
jgi:hypothetical protein